MHVTVDARYFRKQPSGLGEYTKALVERMPGLAPDARFTLWVSPTAPVRPVSSHPNVREQVVEPGPNGLTTLVAPSRLGDLRGTDLFHEPFNIMGRGIRCPTVVTVHDLMWVIDPTLIGAFTWMTVPQWLYYRTGALHALRHATRVVTDSQASADWILKYVPAARPRLHVIPIAAHSRFAPPADPVAARARAAELVGDARPYMLVVGRNGKYKWHEGAVRALAGLRDRDALLVLVQRLDQGGPLGRLARELGVEKRIRWLESQSEANIVTLMQCATALVQPSKIEGFGLPVLEAMACGTPVVASDTPALVEVAGGAALHVPRDVRALARAMDDVLADASLRADLRLRGLARAAQFSWDRTARETLAVYREALA